VPSGSGLLYAAIIGMWALVLVPMWLRRHDEAQESKSADRFARAMGTLRRGGDVGSVGGSSGTREVLMPGRPNSVRATQVTVTGAGAELSPAAAAAARRRRVLAILGLLLAGWVVLALLHVVPRWTVAVPSLLVVGFLVVARRQVALAADLRRRQARRVTLADAARAADARYGAGESRARRGGRVVAPAPAAQEMPVTHIEVPIERVAVGDSWNAVPTTLPTYVTAPRATTMPRVIDLTTPGSWSGAAMVEQARGTLNVEQDDEGAMRVETFEVAVPRDPAIRAGVLVEPATYADRFVEDDIDVAALAEDDLDTLLDDPRTGVHGPTWRRAANG
jgi:hypothetical protein